MAFVRYTIQPYDRWDSIAAKAYGQPERWPEITAANPGVKLDALPPVGVVISIPVIEATSDLDTDNIGLPPWRR